MLDRATSSDAETVAYREGQRDGLAVAALAISLLAFINLFGLEKSLFAVFFSMLSMQGATKLERAYGWSRTAIVIAIIQVVVVATLLVVYHSTFIQLLQILEKLG
jgi:hypothetical protein